MESTLKSERKVRVEAGDGASGREKGRGIGYVLKGPIVEVLGTFALKHSIFSFAGPVSSYALSFVFWYRCPWLFSLIEGKFYPSICNGERSRTANVFSRYAMMNVRDDRSDEEYCDMDKAIREDGEGIPRSEACISNIMEFKLVVNSEAEIEEYHREDEDPLYLVYSEFDFRSEDEETRASINLLPNVRSHIIDVREKELRRALEEREAQYRGMGYVPPLETPTHFFDCYLLPADISKILYRSQIDDSDMISSASTALFHEVRKYSPQFQLWLWKETGGYEDAICVSRSGSHRNMGWVIPYQTKGSEMLHEGEILPLDVIAWKMKHYWCVHFYIRYERDCLKSGVEPNQLEFVKKYPQCIPEHLPSWYEIHIGAKTISDIPPSSDNVVDAVSSNQYHYAEMFIARGDVKEVSKFTLGGSDLKIFKMLEKHVGIPYQDIRFNIPHRSLSVYYFASIVGRTFYDALRFDLNADDTDVPYQQSSGMNIKSEDILNYLIDSGRFEDTLPSVEIDQKEGKRVQSNIERRIESMYNSVRYRSSAPPLESGEEEKESTRDKSYSPSRSLCIINLFREVLDYCDRSKTRILHIGKWETLISRHIANLSGIDNHQIKLAYEAARDERVREILKILTKTPLNTLPPREALKLFVKGYRGGESTRG